MFYISQIFYIVFFFNEFNQNSDHRVILVKRRNSRKLSNYNLWVAYIVYLTFHSLQREFSNKLERSIKMLIN